MFDGKKETFVNIITGTNTKGEDIGRGSYGKIKFCPKKDKFCMKQVSVPEIRVKNEFLFGLISYLHYPELFAEPYGYSCDPSGSCIIFMKKYSGDLLHRV